MAKSFMQMVNEAAAEVPRVSPAEAHRRLHEDPNALLLELRDTADVPASEIAPNAVNVSLGMLAIRADLEVPEYARDPRLQDRSRQIITTCKLGNLAAMGARLLKDMGFTNVAFMNGGMQAWKEAGLPTKE
jgi:rhodanese-related sulfurtransferase